MVLPYLVLVAPTCRDQLHHSKRTHNYPCLVGHLFSTACLWLSLLSEPNLGKQNPLYLWKYKNHAVTAEKDVCSNYALTGSPAKFSEA